MTARRATRSLPFTMEVAISAVSYDAHLVAELSNRIAVTLGSTPGWLEAPPVADAAPLSVENARVLLVLHQRLSSPDVAALKSRMRSRPESVCVARLDDAPLPEWLDGARLLSLPIDGLKGITSAVLDCVALCGGAAREADPEEEAQPRNPRGWQDGPKPFLDQPRASSSLRVQFEAIASELRPHIRQAGERVPGLVAELHSLPNRLVMHVGSVALSFSWVAGAMGNVSDGRLMVIEWTGVRPRSPRGNVLEAAVPVRECVYKPEATDAENWRWRSDTANGEAYSTSNLARQWIDSASLAATTVAQAS